MIRFELYVTLYLLAGVVYYLAMKHVINDAIEDTYAGDTAHRLVILIYIVAWLPIMVVDAFFFVRYLLRRRE